MPTMLAARARAQGSAAAPRPSAREAHTHQAAALLTFEGACRKWYAGAVDVASSRQLVASNGRQLVAGESEALSCLCCAGLCCAGASSSARSGAGESALPGGVVTVNFDFEFNLGENGR